MSGAQKALGYRLNPVMAALLGMLTGIGGRMLRDLLITQIPTVLRAELYAVAALAGAAVVVVGHTWRLLFLSKLGRSDQDARGGRARGICECCKLRW